MKKEGKSNALLKILFFIVVVICLFVFAGYDWVLVKIGSVHIEAKR